jgi:pimeloyl-ACP methyl ester carboxylesterase
MPWLDTVLLSHNKVRLALHQLQGGGGPSLLLLHGLGEHTPHEVPAEVASWPGPIWGLDFTGHGQSTVPKGGGYTCELLMADADIALGHLGEATVYGRGLGAYVGVLLAGARPRGVRGMIVADGPGLAGGGTRPSTVAIITVDPGDEAAAPPDPYALQELSRDVRPTDYAAGFAREAVKESALPSPVVVSAFARPPWLAAVAEEYGVEVMPVAQALGLFGSGRGTG